MNPITPKKRRRFIEPGPRRQALSVSLNERVVASLRAWEATWGVSPSHAIDALFFFAMSQEDFRLPLQNAKESKIKPLNGLVPAVGEPKP